MNSRTNSKDFNSISSFIDSLVANPPLPNPLKKSASQRNINALPADSQITIPEQALPLPLSPLKKRAHSEDKDKPSQLFSTIKNYAEQGFIENSMLLSRASDFAQASRIPPKEVRFRENIIMKNTLNRKESLAQEPRTPSILKKSQLLRNNCAQFLQQNSQLSTDKQPVSLAEDRQERAAKTNEVVKRRYCTILERFQAKFAGKLRKNCRLRSDEKYQDDLFPPIASSILRGGVKNQEGPKENIRWVRISELFKHRNLKVIDSNRSNLQIKCEHGCSFMGEVFTAIRNCRPILAKMFESTEVSEFGVYIVKIFQENVWKYVIVDDFIPVQPNSQGTLRPSFINCVTADDSAPLEIWPFLLEKAYANYYANYESLHFGNTLDFLEELTGLSAEVFHYIANPKKQKQSSIRLERLISLESIIILGFIEVQNLYVPLERNQEGNLTACLQEENQITVGLQQVYDYFDRIYMINPEQWTHSAVSAIGINVKRKDALPRFDISLRTLKLTKPGTISLSVRQKEKRFYQRSNLNYSYIWVRVILLQREFDGDCRWIDARYSNAKSINFLRRLQAGEYYIILLPEWKSSHCYELSLVINCSVPIGLKRRQYEDGEQLVEKGCCDLAQRMGKMNQINLYACSYTLVNEEVGLLVENINNERYQGDIRITRSLAGLAAAVDLLPFNREFYLHKNPKGTYSTHLTAYIPADKSYTVVLMMRGGIDLSFLRKFDFGK